jgi:virginiamycin B lyase
VFICVHLWFQKSKIRGTALATFAALACAFLSAQEPGDLLQGRVREWTVPVADSAPNGIAVDPRGNVWLTLLRANQIARLNPRLNAETGEWKLFALPTPDSGPLGIVSDAGGNIWYAASAAGKIGRIDAATGAVTKYATPGGAEPHALIIGPGGSLWFTAPRANLIVRMDARSGRMQEFAVPTPDARPEALTVGPDGMLWCALVGASRLARVNPASGKITEYEIPFEGSQPRGLWALEHPVAAIYYTDAGRGTLGRFEIERLSFKEWRSPSGPGSQPHAIAADGDGILWYSESSANQIVRFDPIKQAFRRFTLPSPRSDARSMAADQQGRVWLALPGANKVALVE